MYVILLSTLILVLQFVENLLWALYIRNASKNKMLKAAIYGELITLIGVVGFYSWLESFWYVIPTVVGGFLGTYFSDKIYPPKK